MVLVDIMISPVLMGIIKYYQSVDLPIWAPSCSSCWIHSCRGGEPHGVVVGSSCFFFSGVLEANLRSRWFFFWYPVASFLSCTSWRCEVWPTRRRQTPAAFWMPEISWDQVDVSHVPACLQMQRVWGSASLKGRKLFLWGSQRWNPLMRFQSQVSMAYKARVKNLPWNVFRQLWDSEKSQTSTGWETLCPRLVGSIDEPFFSHGHNQTAPLSIINATLFCSNPWKCFCKSLSKHAFQEDMAAARSLIVVLLRGNEPIVSEIVTQLTQLWQPLGAQHPKSNQNTHISYNINILILYILHYIYIYITYMYIYI